MLGKLGSIRELGFCWSKTARLAPSKPLAAFKENTLRTQLMSEDGGYLEITTVRLSCAESLKLARRRL